MLAGLAERNQVDRDPRTARIDIQGAGGPIGKRNIVLFTDAKANQGGDPFAEAQAACDAGIQVHTIAYGDADFSSLIQLTDCGTTWVSGTEDSTASGYDEPDVLEIKSHLARMQHHVDEQNEIHERRGYLEDLVHEPERLLLGKQLEHLVRRQRDTAHSASLPPREFREGNG